MGLRSSYSYSCSVYQYFHFLLCKICIYLAGVPWLYLTASVFLRTVYVGGFVYALFYCNYLILNCLDAGVQQWRKVMARQLRQMLSAKGSSPAGDAAKAQRREQVFHVYMQAEPEAKNQQLLWELGFASGWLRQGLHCQRGLSAQAGNQECKLGASGHLVHGLVFQGVPRNGTEKNKWRSCVWRLCIMYETVTAVFLNVC